jgi:hypothetical protein
VFIVESFGGGFTENAFEGLFINSQKVVSKFVKKWQTMGLVCDKK